MFRERQYWTLVTAIPLTKGHEDLIRFTSRLAGGYKANIVLSVKQGEPMIAERTASVSELAEDIDMNVSTISSTFSQDPNSPGFWEYWRDMFYALGFREGDFLVGSETYIKKLADNLDGVAIPYDIARIMRPVCGTQVRESPVKNFSLISSYMQKCMQKTFVMFGAESVGKTTLARSAATNFGGVFIPEFARPFLAFKYGAESRLTSADMEIIFRSQCAVEEEASRRKDTPFIWHDTDILSTYGYIKLHPELLDGELSNFKDDVESHLTKFNRHYFLIPSNIPFESDPQRYGGDKRESNDEFWLDILDEFNVSFSRIYGHTTQLREGELANYANFNSLSCYERQFN